MNSKYAAVYYDTTHPESFGGARSLWKSVGGTLNEAKEWLQTQDTYTLHRSARKKFPRNKIQVAGIDDQWEADLIDVQKLAKENKNFKYLLTVIDSLSKYAWVVPLKDKTGESVLKAFKQILKSRQPNKLRTDKGKEFLNWKVQHFLKLKRILFFTSNNDTKAAIVERFNRTLCTKLWRYFTASKQQTYIHVLSDIVQAYNDKKHSSTGLAPSNVTVFNGETVWRKMYRYPKRNTPVYNVGDRVRISKAKNTFEKGYKTNWRSEIFIINKVIRKPYPEYVLNDLHGEDILGTFNEFELQRVRQTDIVNKIIRRKGKDQLLTEYKHGYQPII